VTLSSGAAPIQADFSSSVHGFFSPRSLYLMPNLLPPFPSLEPSFFDHSTLSPQFPAETVFRLNPPFGLFSNVAYGQTFPFSPAESSPFFDFQNLDFLLSNDGALLTDFFFFRFLSAPFSPLFPQNDLSLFPPPSRDRFCVEVPLWRA